MRRYKRFLIRKAMIKKGGGWVINVIMSIVSLQFGQCGNQIGNSLYDTISDDINVNNSIKSIYNCCAINKWFDTNKHGKWEPRSILIDTESKVVQNTKPLPFSFKNVIVKSFGGSANNWAYGYTRTGPLLKKEILNVVRCEVEKCDYLSSFLNLFSSSGGTGSGVGGFIVELLRDEYPNKHITNAIVLPYIKGEIVTQSYNSLLTLSHLYSLADSTILFENERLHYICKYTMGIQDVMFSNMNSVIAQQLAAVYQPVNHVDNVSLLNHLTSHPHYKYLQIKSEPHYHKENVKYEGSRQWKNLVACVSKQSRFDFMYQKDFKLKHKVISSTLITRGADCVTENDVKAVRDRNDYVTWLTKNNSFNVLHQKRNFLNFDKFLCLLSNNNSVCMPLTYIVNDAWNLFTHGAYLHHYKKYDVEEEFFLNSFQLLENILEYYNTLNVTCSSWSFDDKKKLLVLLQRHGASNLELIQQNMPDKTITDIRSICEKHTKLAFNKWCLEEGKKPKVDQAVNNWLHILKQISSSQRGAVQDIIPRVLKYIALFEKRSESAQVSLSDCYLVLSDISNGVASKHLDETKALKNGEIESYKNYLRNLDNLNDGLSSNLRDKKEYVCTKSIEYT
ncbi:hypothetical protein NQ318_011951 [Aromia moschata]|uniref:Tubulin delta chain n=1 Tax=Aromia moschata TaxID=1265417 RepID=A0AAV8XEU8_9CUCU|nr:hypothetical protein NQ318_011951 [Aromia moschata]